MSSIYLFGATSMAGWGVLSHCGRQDLVPFCNPNVKLEACQGWYRLDLEKAATFEKLFAGQKPKAVIHCAGICDVEKCEAHPEWAHAVNVRSMERLLANIPEETRLVYVSSDHVFGGRNRPYNEDAEPDPITVYGRTRVAAEKMLLNSKENALVLRYALGIGSSANGRTGHLDWMAYRKRKGLPITVVRDEYRSAVWLKDLAHRIMDYTRSAVTGLRHITATRSVSRVELAGFLDKKYDLGVEFSVVSRAQRGYPHLGKVKLSTVHRDALADPLDSVVPSH